MDFELVTASRADEPALQNLMQLYIHDFSERWAGEARGELGDDGRFGDYPLDGYWRDAGWRPYLIRTATALAGFALVNDAPHSELATDHSMAEFFVVRKHRRRGLGALAAQRLFGALRGVWEVAVARKNTGALAFWRRTIGDFAGASEISEHDLTGPDWNGPVIRFRSA
jgi:predicted acetyltransferase